MSLDHMRLEFGVRKRRVVTQKSEDVWAKCVVAHGKSGMRVGKIIYEEKYCSWIEK